MGMNLPSEEELIRAMRDAIMREDGVEAAGEFDAWVQHMKKEHPEQALFMVVRKPIIRFHVTIGDEEELHGEIAPDTHLHEPQAVPTEHQLKMKPLWEKFRRNTDKYGFEHAPVLGEEGWQEFWKEAIEQREEYGLEQLLPRLDNQWRDRVIPGHEGQQDAYTFLEAEIDGLTGKPSKSKYKPKKAVVQFWNEQLKNIPGLE